VGDVGWHFRSSVVVINNDVYPGGLTT